MKGSAEDFKGAKKEIEDIAQPIIAALYQQGKEDPENHHSQHEL